MSYLGLEDSVDNDPCKFVLSCRGSSERFTLQAANVDIKQVWVRHIQEVLDAQSNFLSGEGKHTQTVRLQCEMMMFHSVQSNIITFLCFPMFLYS